MNPKSTKVLIIGVSHIQRKDIIEQLSLSDIEVVRGPVIKNIIPDNFSLEVALMAPDHFKGSYTEGYCSYCGTFLYDSKTTASSSGCYCKSCRPAPPPVKAGQGMKKKKKKSRMSRVEKAKMYGGKF